MLRRSDLIFALWLGVAPAFAPEPALADGEPPAAAPRTVDCAGASASVAGDKNQIRFEGKCLKLDVAGSGNDVEIELGDGAAVHVEGERNRVVIHPATPDAQPVIDAGGDGNDVSLAAPAAQDAEILVPAPPAAVAVQPATDPTPWTGALVLDGDGQNQLVSCRGRDVLIHGSDGRYRLTGGCRSVSVQGSGTRIEAELEPGARVSIGGRGVLLNYILTAPGPVPALSVSGRDSHARQVDHLSPILGPARP